MPPVNDWLWPLLASYVTGFLIGLERERHKQSAGLRTFTLIALFSCFTTLLSANAFRYSTDPMIFDRLRLAANLLTGVGFLGAGAIWKDVSTYKPDRIHGLTTGSAMMLTVTAGIGYAAKWYLPTAVLVGLAIFTLALVPKWFPETFKGRLDLEEDDAHKKNGGEERN